MEHDDRRAIAREAVRETLLVLGLSLDDVESVQAAQADFAFMRQQRKAAEAFKGNAIRTAWTVIGMGLFGFLTWLVTALHWPSASPPPGAH